MKKPWLHIIGIGEEGYQALLSDSHKKIEAAKYIIGGKRHLAMLPLTIRAEKICWLSPLKQTVQLIAKQAGKQTIILASGDPMDYGIGVTLARHFALKDMSITPYAGAFSYALSRLGWARHHTHCQTLHGRDIAILNPYLQPAQNLLILAHDGDSPKMLSKHLTDRGFGTSLIQVLSHLGGEKETAISFYAKQCPKKKFPDLSVIAVSLSLADDTDWYSIAAGLADNAYHHDGKITKAEIRAATLAKLKPSPQALLWDLGAGSGSIAIEWTRLGGHAIAVERDPAACQRIGKNIQLLGNDKVTLMEGTIAQAIPTLPTPDAIFIGGGLNEKNVAQAFKRLAKGGRIVINAVTMESQMILFKLAQEGGDLCRISVARLSPVGEFHGFKPLMDVIQFVKEK